MKAARNWKKSNPGVDAQSIPWANRKPPGIKQRDPGLPPADGDKQGKTRH